MKFFKLKFSYQKRICSNIYYNNLLNNKNMYKLVETNPTPSIYAFKQ